MPRNRGERWTRFDEWAQDDDEALTDLLDWLLSMGELGHLTAFCTMRRIPYSAVRNWLRDNQDRENAYMLAKAERVEAMAEALIAIADCEPGTLPHGGMDSAAVAHAKLRIDTRRWYLSKLAPKQYSDRVEVDATVTHDVVSDLRTFLATAAIPLIKR